MSLGPVEADRLDFSDPSAPRSERHRSAYSAIGIDPVPRQLLSGNRLPERWSGRRRFVILQTGFGLGSAFLATWAAWRADPRRCDRLWFIAVEPHPLDKVDLERAHQGCDWPDLARQLQTRWPAHTPDMHVLDLDEGRVRLMLAFGPVSKVLPQLVAGIDAVYLTGHGHGPGPSSAPLANDERALRSLHRLAANGATLAATNSSATARAHLVTAGFVIARMPSADAADDGLVADFAPRVAVAGPVGHAPSMRADDAGASAVVVGGGLAGAAAAHALARQGVSVVVLDSHAGPAQAASGMPAGLFHGVVHPQDGAHARWLRAAALFAHGSCAAQVSSHRIAGQVSGLLRGEQGLSLQTMQSLLQTQALPADWMQAWSADRAALHSGVPWHNPAWFCAQGGWLSPVDLTAHWLRQDGIEWRGQTHVSRALRIGNEWHLIDRHGHELIRTPVLVLAAAEDTVRLLGSTPGAWQRIRGQVSLLNADTQPCLKLPIADRGYALRMPDGRLLCGSTSNLNDDDPGVRPRDHALNAETLQRLTGWRAAADAAPQGRVGWRMQTSDRLPWVGPAPDATAGGAVRADQARFVPRRAGLYVLAGLGSRGLTHAALAGELLAAWITGAPMPVLSDLVDAVDVARFTARAARLTQS